MRVFLCFALSLLVAVPATAQTKPTILQSTSVSSENGAVVVVLQADGPLPTPSTGHAESPVRFYLDFVGVIAGTRGTREGHAPVTGVRVALNRASPPMTRVVLDLAERQRIRVDDEALGQGWVRIIIGDMAQDVAHSIPAAPIEQPRGESSPDAAPLIPIPTSSSTTGSSAETGAPAGDPFIPPVPDLPAPPAHGNPEKSPDAPRADLPAPEIYPVVSADPPPRPSLDDLNQYRDQVLPQLDRLYGGRSLLTDIDRQDSKPPEGLAAARSEFSAVIRVLAGVHPPDTLKATHDMLLRAASLSLMAATLRADAGPRADPTAVRNAASAAAGALLLIDRVCTEIGCPDRFDRK